MQSLGRSWVGYFNYAMPGQAPYLKAAFGQAAETIGDRRSDRRRGFSLGVGEARPNGEFSAVGRFHPERSEHAGEFALSRFMGDHNGLCVVVRFHLQQRLYQHCYVVRDWSYQKD